MIPWRAALAALGISTGAATAEDVTLTARVGGQSYSGTLLEYDGAIYRIATKFGPLSVAADAVECSGPPCEHGPPPPTITLGTVPTLAGWLAPQVIGAYATARGRRAVSSRAGDTDVFELVSDNGVEARIRLTVPDDPERALRLGAVRAVIGPALGERPVLLGRDALVALVAPDNPARVLPLGRLADIRSGRRRDWTDLGAPPRPMALHAVRGEAVEPPVVRHATPLTLSYGVARVPGALGLGPPSPQGGPARILPVGGPCGLEVAATEWTRATGDYPLTRPRFLSAAPRPVPLLTDVAGFLTSPTGRAFLSRHGLDPPGLLERPPDPARVAAARQATRGDLPAETLRAFETRVAGAHRLSPTFRFRAGATTLDAASSLELEQLGTAVGEGKLGGTLLLLGFSDGAGPAAANLALSRRRAEAVRDALDRRLGPGTPGLEIVAEGFGEALPIVCDDTRRGRRINRRVEVWHRPAAREDPPPGN